MYGRNRYGTTRYGAAGGRAGIFTKALSAVVNVSGSVARAVGKPITGTINVSGTVARAIAKALAGTVNVSASLTKMKIFHKALTAAVEASVTVTRAMTKALSATVNIHGTVARAMTKALTATVNIHGTVARAMTKAITATVNIHGTVERAMTKALTATVNIVASLTKMKIFHKALAATVEVSGAVQRSIGKAITATVNIHSTVGRDISKALAAVVNISAAVARETGKIVGGGVEIVATVGRVIHKSIMATVNAGATVAREAYDMAYEMNKTIRTILAKVQITYTDPFFSAGIEAEATETGRYTYPTQTTDNVQTEAFKWFSLHRNTLDGTFHPLPSNQEYSVGWWGATLSNAVTGAFTPGSQLLTITHTARTIESLLVVGDDKLEEYPVDFTVRLYSTGDVLEYTKVVTENALVTYEFDCPDQADIVKQTLDVLKWSRVSSVCKISQFYTMLEETYTSEDGELFGVRVLEEMEYSEPTIPQGNISANSIRIRLNNIDRLFTDGNYHSRLSGMLLNNRAIKAWLGCDCRSGVRAWFPLGTFYSRDWKAPEGEAWAEVTGYDMLDRLKQTEFSTSEVYTDVTLHDLAVTVMTDAGLTSADWDIDAALDTADYTIPYAWFSPMSHREALRRIAAAALGQVYCNRDGIVVIEIYEAAAATTHDFEFYEGNFFDIDHPLDWSKMINSVQARANPRVASALQDICLDTETFTVPTGSSVSKTHFFDFTPCVDVADNPAAWVFVNPGGNVTCTAVTTYAWGCVATYENGNGGDETVTSVTIQGKPLEVQGGRIVEAEDATSIASNGRQTLSSPITSEFWQTEAQSQAAADALLASWKDPLRNVQIKARGNIAELLGDRIIAPDYSDEVTSEFSLARQDINYDGGMEVMITGQNIIGGHTIYHKSLATTLNVEPSIVVAPNPHEGGIEISASVERVISKQIMATVNAAGTVGRETAKALAGTVNVGGAIDKMKIFHKSLTGTANVIGTVN